MMTNDRRQITIVVPGTRHSLTYHRDAAGRLLRLEGGGRTYVEALADGVTYVLDGDLARVSTVVTGAAVLRHVRGAGQAWTETYRFDAEGRLAFVDGTTVDRDTLGRVTACHTPQGAWRYAYRGGNLSSIVRPDGTRRVLAWDAENRPHRAHQPIEYGPGGMRRGIPPLPQTWHVDELGRLWAVAADEGDVRAIFLWDGFTCLGRIDGPPGTPMAAAFTCDPSFTPVRVVERRGVTRIARDAFGEGLLDHPGIPGLFGGAIYGGFVHFRFRTLDPLLGVFDRPDPWDGGPDDPRRQDGFTGPLAIDAAGRYAVSHHDAVGRTDPLGASSTGLAVLVHLSSLTWSMQNNILGALGLDLTVNWWSSLFTGFQVRNFFEYGAHTGKRQKTFAIRRSGVVAQQDRAWTFQHILWARGEHIDENADVHVVDPEGRYAPSLYGTVMRVVPQPEDDDVDDTPLLLSGDRGVDGDGLRNWTRGGSVGESVFPGSSIPYFARGGFHLDNPVDGLRAFDPMACTLAELEPTETLFTAVFDGHQAVSVARADVEPDDGTDASPHVNGRLLFITDTADHAGAFEIERVETVGATVRLWLADAPSDLDDTATPWRVRTLDPRPDAGPPTEDVPVGPEPSYLNVAASAAAHVYAAGDPVRFLDPAGPVLGAGLVDRFETQIELTDALPAGLTQPFDIQTLTNAGNGTADIDADGNLENFSTPPPGAGCFLQVTGGGSTITVQILDVTGGVATIDPKADTLGAAGDTVDWVGLCVASHLGARVDALDPAALTTLTYVPDQLRTPPAVGDFVLLTDASATPRHEARAVDSVTYDAVVFRQALPAAPGIVVRAELYDFLAAAADGHVDVADASLTRFVSAPLDADADLDGVAVGLVEVTAAELASPVQWQYAAGGGTAAENVTVVGGLGGAPRVLRPVQLVVLVQGGEEEQRLVRSVSVKATLDRQLDFDVPEGIEMIRLQSAGPPYEVELLPPDRIRVRPRAGNPLQDVHLPHFREGELVMLQEATIGADHLYRVASAEAHGSTLTLEDGPPGGLPAGPLPDLRVVRLVPRNPGTGGTRIARNGRDLVVAAGVSEARVDVWRSDALDGSPAVAVVGTMQPGGNDVRVSRPARVAAISEMALSFASASTFDPTTATVEIRVPNTVNRAYAPEARTVDDALVIDGVDLAASANVIVVYGLQELNATEGRLSPGTTLVPNDPDDNELKPMELDRRQALIDHELRHTEQCALLGPWLLSVFPMAPLEWLISDEEIEPLAPRFSAFVEAAVEETQHGRLLRFLPEATHDIQFETGDLVQVARSSLAGGTSGTAGDHPGADRYAFTPEGSPDLPEGTYFVTTPDRSRHAVAYLRQEDNQLILQIPPSQQFNLHNGQSVELTRAGRPVSFRLGAGDGDGFVIEGDPAIPTGIVRVRRAFPEASGFWGGFYDVFDFMTAGSITKFIFSLTWGGAIELFGRIGYSIFRLFSSETHFTAQMGTDPRVLTFDGGRPQALVRNAYVLVVSDDKTAVRRIASTVGNDITVDRALPYRAATVEVYPYTDREVTSDWDWHDYYPAEVDNINRPTAVRVAEVNGERPSFSVFDRVIVADDTDSIKTRVTRVIDDAVVELETVPGFDEEQPDAALPGPLRIAPSRLVDNFFLDLAERPVIRWFFDPYGLMDPNRRSQPGDDPPQWASVLGQIARHLFGTRQWSALPAGGYYFWDNLPPQIKGEGFRSGMEQDASEESGDIYSPMARLRPDPDAIGHVGDIGLFYYWPDGSRRTFNIYGGDIRDLAGSARYVQDAWRPRVLPSTSDTAADADPNGTIEAAAGSGLQLPDMLFEKGANDPTQPPEANPASYIASPQGILPSSALLERVSGHYVAFTRPSPADGHHRATVRNDTATDTNSLDQARATQDGVGLNVHQPIFFDVEVHDVTLRFGVQTIGEGDTLTLVVTQQLALSVDAGGGSYVLSMMQPETSDLIRTDGGTTFVAQGTTGDEPAEVSRFYAFTPGADADDPVSVAMGGTYAESRLAAHGVHVPQDLYVPVRRLTVEVVDTLPLRSQVPTLEEVTADLDAHAITDVSRGGEAFILIPVATGRDVDGDGTLEDFTVRQGGADLTDAQVTAAGLTLDPSVDVSEALRLYLGEDGTILRLAVAADADLNPYELVLHTPTANVDVTVGFEVVA